MSRLFFATLLFTAAFASACKARRNESTVRNSGAPVSAVGSATLQIKFFNEQGADGICSGSLLSLPRMPSDKFYILTSAHCFFRITTKEEPKPHEPALDEQVLPDELLSDTELPAGGKGVVKLSERLVESRGVRVVQVNAEGNGSGGRLVPIAGYWIHPNYRATQNDGLIAGFDLAVIAFNRNKGWPEARGLSEVPAQLKMGFLVSGFGVTVPNKNDSGKLREGPAKVDERSIYMFRSATTDPALGVSEEVTIGPGDSGGPALVNYGNGDRIIGVIASFSRSKAVTERIAKPEPPSGGGIALFEQNENASDKRFYSFFVDVLAPENIAFIEQPSIGWAGPP